MESESEHNRLCKATIKRKLFCKERRLRVLEILNKSLAESPLVQRPVFAPKDTHLSEIWSGEVHRGRKENETPGAGGRGSSCSVGTVSVW